MTTKDYITIIVFAVSASVYAQTDTIAVDSSKQIVIGSGLQIVGEEYYMGSDMFEVIFGQSPPREPGTYHPYEKPGYGPWEYEPLDSMEAQRLVLIFFGEMAIDTKRNDLVQISGPILEWVHYKINCYMDSTKIIVPIMPSGAIWHNVEVKEEIQTWHRRPTSEGFEQYKLNFFLNGQLFKN